MREPSKRQTPALRHDLPPGLWVVATPIGNLGDLSVRALAALADAHVIFCEDTRVAARLLSSQDIPARGRLRRLDAHTRSAELDRLMEEVLVLQDTGQAATLITDAGTPGVSDPGAGLVQRCLEGGVRVTAVPGPSAVATFVSISGAACGSFTFNGFFPRRPRDREAELERGAREGGLQIWFESPERMVSSAREMVPVLERLGGYPVIIAKELTKSHERIWRGNLSTFIVDIESASQGEWVFGVEYPNREALAALREEGGAEDKSSDWVKALECLLGAQVSASVAARQVSQVFGVSKRLVYDRALSLSGKKFLRRD